MNTCNSKLPDGEDLVKRVLYVAELLSKSTTMKPEENATEQKYEKTQNVNFGVSS